MKKTSALLGALALILAAVTAGLAFFHRSAILIGTPGEAMEQGQAVLEQLCAGDYAGASQGMAGQPDLGADREPEDPVGQLLWQAFLDSLQYEFLGQPYATDSGLAWDARVTCLDFEAVTGNLGSRSRNLLDRRMAQAEDVSEIYNEKNEFREDVVLEVLYEAAREAIREDSRTETRDITLKLVCDDGRWWVVPDGELLNVFSWGTVAG